MPLLLILLKMTLLLVGALALTILMQRASAGSRHLVWLTALSALLLLPALATWGPVRLSVLPEAFGTDRASAFLARAPQPPPPAVTRLPVNAPAGDRSSTIVPTANPAPGLLARAIAVASSNIGVTLLGVWLVVALCLLGWLGFGALSVRRIVHRAKSLDDPEWQRPLFEIADRLGLEAAPRLVRSGDVKMPFASGMFRGTIVLPAECDGWSADRRSAVLIHELGHVRRHDLIGHTLGRLACSVYWFHPMVWSAARRLRAESERACDDLALHFGARPADYAEHLLDIVTCVRDHATPSVALAMAHRKEFEGRMLAILNPDLRRTGFRRGQTATLVGVVALLSLVISAAAPPVAPVHAPVSRQAPSTPVGTDSPGEGLPVNVKVAASVQVNTRVNTRVNTNVLVATALKELGREFGGTTDADTTGRAKLLVQLLRGDSSADVRRIAAWGLSRYDSDTSVRAALAAALATDTNERVRAMAAWAMANSDESDVTALAHAALGDHAEQVREMATWGLGNHGGNGDANTVAKVLGADRSSQVRATAAWALGQFGLKAAPKSLVAALTDSNEEVRYKAAWAASEIGDSATRSSVRAALRTETSARAQRAELRALIRAGEDPEKMVEWLRSKDQGIREMAARALAGGQASEPWPWPWPRPMPQP